MKRPLTHAQLDEKVALCWRIGGLYQLLAREIERRERPHAVGERTGVLMPWVS